MIEHSERKGGGSRHPVFDAGRFARLLQADSGRASATLSILANVIANGCTPVSEARSAFHRKQPAQAAHVIHNLKGCIANLGGMRVFEIACLLEPKLEAGVDQAEAHLLLEKLEREMTAYLAAARGWLSEGNQWLVQHTNVEQQQLQQLKQYLLDSNILACDLFDELRPVLQMRLSVKDYQSLAKAIDNMNFSQAMAHLTYAR